MAGVAGTLEDHAIGKAQCWPAAILIHRSGDDFRIFDHNPIVAEQQGERQGNLSMVEAEK